LSSHQTCLTTPLIPGFQIIKFVLLRDPLKRFFSLYNYHRRIELPKTVVDFKAKELSFNDFMKWLINNTKLVSSNFQTNFCSKTGSYADTITSNEFIIAKENLLRSEGVGVVERYTETLLLFNRVLQAENIQGEIINYHENKSEQKEDTLIYIEEHLGPELVQQIKDLNNFDYELYDCASTLLDEKLEMTEEQL